MALLRSLFKVPQHQKFEFKTRYYDQRKEELEELLKRVEGNRSGDPEVVKNRLAKGFRKGGYSKANSSYRTKQVRQSNIILLALIVLLIFVAYLVMTQYLPDFLEVVGKR